MLVPEAGDVHEDGAGLVAAAVAGGDPGWLSGWPGPVPVDLVAAVAGVVQGASPRSPASTGSTRLEVFTVADGRVVAPGDLVASVKVAPHLVAGSRAGGGEAIARRGGPRRVRPFRPVRIAVIVKERVAGAARDRFEASVHARVAGLGATLA